MPVPSSINDLSTTAGSNSPSGSETPTEGDNYLRTLSSFLALLRDKLNGTSDTGTVKNASFQSGSFSGTFAGSATWSGLQEFVAGISGYLPTPDTSAVVSYRNSSSSHAVGTNTVVFESESVDRAADYNTSTGVYTAPKTGIYQAMAVLRMQNNSASTIQMQGAWVSKNDSGSVGVDTVFMPGSYDSLNPAGNAFVLAASAMFSLSAADTLRVKEQHTAATLSMLAGSRFCVTYLG